MFTSAYLNSVRVETQIGGNLKSGVLLVGVDGGIYELVFGSRDGNFKLLLTFDFDVCFDSGPDGEDNSPVSWRTFLNVSICNLLKAMYKNEGNAYHFCHLVEHPSYCLGQLNRIPVEYHR